MLPLFIKFKIMEAIKEKYTNIYKERNYITGRWSYFGQIYENKKSYRTGRYTEKYEYKSGSQGIKILVNNPQRDAIIALDQLIIKNGLDRSKLQILKPK